MKLQSFTGFRGKAATLQLGKVTFMVMARNARQLEEVSNFILKESGQTLLPEMIVPGILIHSSVLPQPIKPQTTNEQQNLES